MMTIGIAHKDIGIFNVIMSDPPVTMEPFETWNIEQLMARFPDNDTDELAKHISLVKNIIEKLGSPDKCYGFVVDGEITTRPEGYYRHRDEKTVSTVSFMG